MNDKHFPDGIIIGKPNHEIVIREGIPTPHGGVTAHGMLLTLGEFFAPYLMIQRENSIVPVSNAGGGEDTLMDSVIPVDLLRTAGDTLKFTATGHVANSAGTKTVKMYANSIALASITCPAATLLAWIAEGEIVRIDDTQLHCHVRLFDCNGASGALGTNWAEFHTDQAIAVGTEIILKFTGTAANGGVDDVTQDMFLTFISMAIPT
jgi:hypothetical protein